MKKLATPEPIATGQGLGAIALLIARGCPDQHLDTAWQRLRQTGPIPPTMQQLLDAVDRTIATVTR